MDSDLKNPSFTREELERYSRQILLYGKKGQVALKSAHILVIGAGGIGCGVLPALASSGVGRITLYDPDTVERNNLGRQNLFHETDIGELKVEVAARRLNAINPYIEIDTLAQKFIRPDSLADLQRYSLILEGSDDLETKFMVSDIGVEAGVPVLIGAIGPAQGHIFPVLPATSTGNSEPSACYRCVFETAPPPGEVPDCATTGVLSALPAVIGSQMAYLASLLLMEGKIHGAMQLIETRGWRSHLLRQNPDCDFCGSFSRD